MYTIHPLMNSIFAIHIMVYFSNPTFSRYNNCFFIIFPFIFSFHGLRTYKKWILSIFLCFIAITASSSNFCQFFYWFIFNSVRTEFLNQIINFTHFSALHLIYDIVFSMHETAFYKYHLQM